MTRLHAHEWGSPDAPAVVCLHGVRGHGLTFRKLAEERLAARFHVVALDLRGHGHSEWEPPWDLPAHLGDLLETADALGIGAAAWIGHSFGGRLVMELSAASPERVERGVWLDPAIWVPPPIALERAEAERADRSFATVEEAIEERYAFSRLLHTPRALLDEEMAEHLVAGDDGRLRYRFAPSAVIGAWGEMAKPPVPPESIRVPSLLVHGADTDVAVAPLIEPYRTGLGPLLRIVAVPGGHNIHWDAFDETADAIERFLV
jgi:lipase